MKRLVIACILILILALTSQAYAMGSHHGRGGGGGSSERGTSSGTTNSTTGSAANNTNNGPTSLVAGGTEGQGPSGGVGITPITPNGATTPASAPELTTLFLLGSALFGLWGLRRKIKK
jgi:hypothetical protein